VAKPRAAGRTQRKLPTVEMPRLPANWRRFVVPTVIVAALAVGGWWLYNSPLLSIKDVQVQGNIVVSAEQARAVAGLDDQSIVQPDLDAARERLLLLPMVKGVQIEQDWPNGVTITLTERVPWGLWQLGSVRYVIDDDGVVIELAAPAGAPLIVQRDGSTATLAPGDRVDAGAMAVSTRLVATAEQTLGHSVRSLEFSHADGLTAFLQSTSGGPGLQVVFGDGQGYDFKLASLFQVLRLAEDEGRTLSRVDLRFGERVAVQ
jgi:cell division protein FtsQ